MYKQTSNNSVRKNSHILFMHVLLFTNLLLLSFIPFPLQIKLRDSLFLYHFFIGFADLTTVMKLDIVSIIRKRFFCVCNGLIYRHFGNLRGQSVVNFEFDRLCDQSDRLIFESDRFTSQLDKLPSLTRKRGPCTNSSMALTVDFYENTVHFFCFTVHFR